MKLLGDVLFIANFIGFLMFSVLYSIVARWWENPAGRNVFAFMALLTGLFGLGVIALILGPETFAIHRNFLRVVCYGSLLAVVVWRIVLLFRVQLNAYADRGDEQDRREVTQNLRAVEQDERESDQNERDRA